MDNTRTKRSAPMEFLFDILRGVLIGIAFIIPGFSGGSIAAILGIYKKLVNAIADLFKDFKNSFFTLLPIGIGMIIGVLSLILPLSIALENYPIPTVSLFVGLALGGIPSITRETGRNFKPYHAFSFIIPLLVAAALSFLPIAAEKDLLALDMGGYILLFAVGIIGSSALVIPGISGSMILLILGYYNPILNILTDHLLKGEQVGQSILVLGTAGVGIVVGFFIISILMKQLLKTCPKGTYTAILGFIIGSVPSIYISTAKEASLTLDTLPTDSLYWIASVTMLAVGFAISLTMVVLASRKGKTDKSKG